MKSLPYFIIHTSSFIVGSVARRAGSGFFATGFPRIPLEDSLHPRLNSPARQAGDPSAIEYPQTYR
jgi:hypothetical protein